VEHDAREMTIWICGVGKMLDYGAFSTAHYMLANKYKSMACNVPRLLTGEDPLERTACESVTTYLLVFLNAAAGIWGGVNFIVFRDQMYFGS
jgi:hypothetical protein